MEIARKTPPHDGTICHMTVLFGLMSLIRGKRYLLQTADAKPVFVAVL